MALPSTTVFECRTSGSDSNGGGFVAGGSGSDYSQQNAAQLSVTDGSAAGTTTLTSATGGFTTAMVDNILQISGGTLNAGFYRIVTRTDTNNVVLDRSPGTGSGSTVKVGGALATPLKAINTAMIGSNTVWIKNGTYTVGTTLTPPSGASGSPSRILGYNATRGDLDAVTTFTNFPTLQASAAIFVITGSNPWLLFRGLILDCNGTGTRGADLSANYSWIDNCKAMKFTQFGLTANGANCKITRCWGTQSGTGATAAFYLNGISLLYGCVASDNANGRGVQVGSGDVVNCVASANGSYGFLGEGNSATFLNCVAYNNTLDGFSLGAGNNSGVFNSIAVDNGGYGINASTTWTDFPDNWNAFYNNTSGARNGVPAGANDVTLSGDPFTNAAGGDFSLNNTAGAGAACRAVGFPGTFSGIGTTGYLDIGAVQSQAGGGGVSRSRQAVGM